MKFSANIMADMEDDGLDIENELALALSDEISGAIDFDIMLNLMNSELLELKEGLGYHRFCLMIGYDDLEGSYKGCIEYLVNLLDEYPDLISFWKL